MMSLLRFSTLALLMSGVAWAGPDSAPVAPIAPVPPAGPAALAELSPEDLVDTDSLHSVIRAEVSAALERELTEIAGLREEVARLRAERDALLQDGEADDEDADVDTAVRRVQAQLSAHRGWHGSSEAVSFGGPVVIEEGMTVEEAASFGGDVEILGTVTGDAVSFGGDVVVRSGGKVQGDATSIGGVVRIEEGGQVLGEADHIGGAVVVEHGGQIQAAMTPQVPEMGSWFHSLFYSLYQKLVFLLAFAGAGVLIVALFPDRVAKVADALREHPLKSGLVGLGGTLGVLIVSLLFFWTVIGPIVLLAILGLAWMIGFVGLCQFLGDRLPFSYKPHGRWLAFLMGSVVISFVGALPWIGVVTVIGASVFGIGAAFVSRMGSR